MSPRPYSMARRRESADENRHRIIQAARELLALRDGSARFSMEEVARRAGVSRMTVYYQFGSFQGLIQGLCDSLAIAGGMNHLADAFRRRDPRAALDEFIAVFVGFWESDRPIVRGLRAMAVLDPAVAAVLEERSGWRRQGLRVLLGRLAKTTGKPQAMAMEDSLDLLYLLTDFPAYDSLAGADRRPRQVAGMIQRAARRIIA